MESKSLSPEILIKKEDIYNDGENNNLIIDKNGSIKSSSTHYSLNEPIYSELDDKNAKICKKCSFVGLFLIILTCLAIGLIIYYILLCREEENFYIFYINWFKNYLNKRDYRNYQFDNGLEVMLIHDEHFDMDGGAIVIDKGYLDYPYDEGIPTFAASLLTYTFETPEINKILNNYFGSYLFEIGEDFTNFYFDIINSGFKKFLVVFSSVLNEERISDYFEKYLNESDLENIKINMNNSYLINCNDNSKREFHLIENLVYNFKDDNNDGILPEGNYDTIDKYDINDLKQKTLNYLKQLINPKNIKIVLFTKYKFLVSSKYMIKSFQYLINKNSDIMTEENKSNSFKNMEFKKSQIIYMKNQNKDPNYIKIIYFIDKINNETYSELYYKKNYFYYIVDILSETKKGSLYYLLTNSFDYNIKILEADVKYILKSKIEFYIYIELNCLKNLNDLIFITYQYMHKIINEAIGGNIQFDRYVELKNIYDQKILYTEKSYETKYLARNNGQNIFKTKYKQYYYFYRYLVPWEINKTYEENINEIKNESYFYYSQLKPENSVIILGLRDNDINNMTCDKNSYFPLNCSYFKDKNNINTTKYYNLEYINTTINSSDFEKYFDINNTANISYVKNKYISKHNEEIQESNESQNYYIKSNNTLNTFHFKKDPTFLVPKLYISINLLHPYLRPLLSDTDTNDCYYFQILEIFSAIKRKINKELTDAIRASNEITVDFNENYLYINIYCYEDVAYKIVKTIKNIILDTKWEKTDFITNNEIYKYETLENFFNFGDIVLENVGQYYFYTIVKNGFYNLYDFDKTKFETIYNKFCFDIIKDNTYKLNKFIVNGLIYGNYNNSEAEKIYELFQRKEIFLYEKDDIQNLLIEVNNNIEVDEYEYWTKEIKELEEDAQSVNISRKIINKADNNNYGFRFINLFDDKFDNSVYLNYSLVENMLNNIESKYSQNLLYLKMFIYDDIYFGLLLYEPDDNKVNPNNNSFVDKLFDTMINESNYYYSSSVDNIGDRFYYLQRNLGVIIFKKQNTFKEKAIEEINYRIYNYTLLNPEEIINEFNNNKKGSFKKFDELKDIFQNIKKNKKLDINTI